MVQTERPWNQMVRTAARFARARDANRAKCLGERRHVGETLQGMAGAALTLASIPRLWPQQPLTLATIPRVWLKKPLTLAHA